MEAYMNEDERGGADACACCEEHPSRRDVLIGGTAATIAEHSVEAIALLDDVRRSMERDVAAAREAALRLVALFTVPDTAKPTSFRGGLAPWQKRKVDRYLREHLERWVRVDKLAEEVSLSVSHFGRAFKESFGDTPHTYIIRLRLELAQKLMLTTDLPLSLIAPACGFADQAHLSRHFRRRLAETPSVWRRRNLTENQAEATNRWPTRSRDSGPGLGA